MGNDATKTKTAKTPRQVTRVKGKTGLNGTKYALVLHKHSTEIMEYFCDAVNQVKPVGCVAVESENIVNLADHDGEIKMRTEEWITGQHHVVILCLSEKNLPRQLFTDQNGKLHSKVFPVWFGTKSPVDWPDAYCIGVENVDKLERPNDFEGEGLDTLVAAIRGSQ